MFSVSGLGDFIPKLAHCIKALQKRLSDASSFGRPVTIHLLELKSSSFSQWRLGIFPFVT